MGTLFKCDTSLCVFIERGVCATFAFVTNLNESKIYSCLFCLRKYHCTNLNVPVSVFVKWTSSIFVSCKISYSKCVCVREVNAFYK
jgi:hypothetical protein